MVRPVNRIRLLLGAALLGGAGSAGLYSWIQIPRTPDELYRARCSACHDLPDLSGYQRHELAPLVNFMRTHNGAHRVISDEEAVAIIAWLEVHWRDPVGVRPSG